ncbi:MAG: RluA family pseudouridine synthase [Rhodospirillales bacterium]|jgi:23S rRNA pseudouridine1911/1915/1917 synthase|nr:RluA family pseudouridine synthase [Rhodospirillales bacterium]
MSDKPPAAPSAAESPQDRPVGPVRVRAVAAEAGERVDRFLARRLTALSRARLQALIAAGLVLRDGDPVRDPAEPVRAGVTYAVSVPAPRPARPVGQAIPLAILHEDRDLIVIDKPAGLVVHPAPGNEDGTLVNALIAHCGPELAVGGEHRPGIVHRLDKDTSGVMVAAKSERAMAGLVAEFAGRTADRAYLALVWGALSPAAGEIEGPIGRDPRDRKRMAIRPHGGGRDALTRYRTLRIWAGGAVSLLECRLATGRTHQIRVHLASRGHPLVGDPVYLRRVPAASRLLPAAVRGRLLDFPRQALHATRLGFVHPRTGATLAFETPPPADMAALLAMLDEAASL